MLFDWSELVQREPRYSEKCTRNGYTGKRPKAGHGNALSPLSSLSSATRVRLPASGTSFALFQEYEIRSVIDREGFSPIEYEKWRETMHFKLFSVWTGNQSQVEVTLNDASPRNFEQKRRSHFWMSNPRNFSRAIKFDYLGS